MTEIILKDFEVWAEQYYPGYDLEKVPAMPTENPYKASSTFKAYQAWCAAKEFYTKEPVEKLKNALIGLIGASTKEELEAMELIIRTTLPAPESDKIAALNAIGAIRSCN